MWVLGRQTFKRKIGLLRREGEHHQESGGRAVLSQDEFGYMLSLERKRSERSRKPLFLALLEGRDRFATNGVSSVRNHVITALLKSTRETDAVGWYQHDSVLGVLFTETGELAAAGAQILGQKIMNLVHEAVSAEEAAQIAVSVFVFPQAGKSSRPPDLTFYPELGSLRKTTPPILKRVIDIVGSVMALLLSWPLWLIIAAIIKITSPGPVFFRQTRIGQCGRSFTFLKFRSMYVNCDSRIHENYIRRLIGGAADVAQADASGNHVYKITNDPRITPFGRFLRRSSLDEMPQFLNVLLGNMSLVGPRPPLPYEVERYEPWHHRRVLAAKPGITGLWQVKGRSRTNFDEMVRLDLQYVDTASTALDLKILLQTPRAVLFGSGGY